MFTIHPNPDHVEHPVHGWLTPEALADHPEDCECGHDLSDLGGRVGKHGGKPVSGHAHFVEHDCATGMVGHTRLTKADQKLVDETALAAAEDVRLRTEKRDNAIAVVSARARDDAGFRAIAQLLGIKADEEEGA